MATPRKSEVAKYCNAMDPWQQIEILEATLKKQSEELAHLKVAECILDHSEDLIFALDVNLNFVYANPITVSYGTRALFCNEKEFLAKDLISIAASDVMKGSDIYKSEFKMLSSLFSNPRSAYIESNIQFEGRLIWLGVWLFPAFNNQGEVTSIVATARNITSYKETQTALANEKERLSVTLASIGDAVITTDTLGNVTTLNKIAEQLTGWQQDEALGHPIEKIYYTIDETNRTAAPNPIKKLLSHADASVVSQEVIDKILIVEMFIDNGLDLINRVCA